MPGIGAKLAQARSDIAQGQANVRDNEFFKVLKEFALELTNQHPGVDAQVEYGTMVKNIFYLSIAPKLHRFERSLMLNCWITNEGIKCDEEKFTNVQNFESYLVEFYKTPTFQESLKGFVERSRSDVHGLLRMSSTTIQAQSDESFRVNSSEFEKLTVATAGSSVSIRAEKEPRFYSRSRPFTPAEMTERLRRFRYFGIDGYGIAMTGVEHDQCEWYTLSGIVQEFGTIR